jgi:RND family efflux transporter MFP subunit
MVQKMNVRTEQVTRRDLTRPIRTVGYLEFDQQRMVTVTTKYSGWIEKVYVNYVGEKVRHGQPLFEIYSPELVQTEQELLSALSFAHELEDAPGGAHQRALSMVESARIRLGYWDVSPQEIERLESTGEVFRTLEVTAPATGLVMKRMAGLEGMAVQPGMELFHLADLSSLWLSVELFEDQLAWVREGTEAKIDLSYFPGETFYGRVRFLEPELSEKTRTMRAKIEVPNPGGHLRKGMYATVELHPVAKRQALTVPTQAVLRTGQRNVVVMALGDGRFAPREVALGHEAEGFAEVLSGLREGDEVVTSAQFLLDSESSLREAIQKMIASRRSPATPPAQAGHQH